MYNSVHRTIGIPPANESKENADSICMKIYGGNYTECSTPKFCVGDVDFRQFKEVIQGSKSLDVNFTPELYAIRKVNRGIPNMYFVKSKAE